MSKFDMIIGYSAVKKELRQIADTLKNQEYYKKLGVSAPHGLLLYGEPGVGKSLMAAAVIEASGRQAFVCRKDQPNGDERHPDAEEVENFYKKAKKILALNTEFLEKVAQALAEKKLLTSADIQEIKNSCKIVPVAL